MNILITGTSRGIGRATAQIFLDNDHTVVGIDKDKSTIDNPNYYHVQNDIRVLNKNTKLPVEEINVLVNNAGIQDGDTIDTNLRGTINVTELFGIQPHIKSILFVASVSAHNGAEFPEYCASKGGMIAYMKNVALRVARCGATCNSISPGGVTTELNAPVTEDPGLWDQIMGLTPLKRWATPEEIGDWIYFLTMVNHFATGQDFLMDGGESTNAHFVWPD